MREKYSFLSFFSGAGGLDLGLKEAGLIPLAANENDRIACQTIRRNVPTLSLYDFDIRELTADRLMSDLGLKPRELFLIAGGPPCQAFSTAGKRQSLNDDRGNVFLHFVHMIGALMPRYIIIENVRGLLSASIQHRPLNERGPGSSPMMPVEMPGGALLHIISLLRGYGYTISFNLYNTANYGVPQVRERLIIFGTRDGGEVPHIPPTHDEKGRGALLPWRTLQDAIGGLTGPMDCGRYPERRLHYFRMLGAGQNWRDLPDGVKQEAMGKAFFAGGGKVGFFRRLAWDKPAPTLVTCPTMPATDLAHPVEDRPLSVQEYEALQTFPVGYELAGCLTDKYRQLGNAVPVAFGAAVGHHLLAYHEGRLVAPKAVVSVSRYKNTDHLSWMASVPEMVTTGQLALL